VLEAHHIMGGGESKGKGTEKVISTRKPTPPPPKKAHHTKPSNKRSLLWLPWEVRAL